MRSFLFLAIGLLATSASFATSPMHPYAASVNIITDILGSREVRDKLWHNNEGIESITAEKLRNGKYGWVVRTGKCALEVEIVYTPVGKIPRFPGGIHMMRSVVVHDCR